MRLQPRTIHMVDNAPRHECRRCSKKNSWIAYSNSLFLLSALFAWHNGEKRTCVCREIRDVTRIVLRLDPSRFWLLWSSRSQLTAGPPPHRHSDLQLRARKKKNAPVLHHAKQRNEGVFVPLEQTSLSHLMHTAVPFRLAGWFASTYGSYPLYRHFSWL